MKLDLNCVFILNWIVWNGTVFDIEIVLTLNGLVKLELFWHLTVKKIYTYTKLN